MLHLEQLTWNDLTKDVPNSEISARYTRAPDLGIGKACIHDTYLCLDQMPEANQLAKETKGGKRKPH
ncbi:hypothetical protein NPX13_g3312 [Xylaria arbuscula]|uniref:Uncharacterized protein n=1 Tax=Xylaria arbuscula TaxID=114810 RepID=A0A9W8TMY1_9PEZI|nr:hypothetical protein NPX13_g3312 [Xylaria arbuscula]